MVEVYVDNLSADAIVDVALDGERLERESNCASPEATSYAITLRCEGAGLVRCGALPALAAGEWVHRITVAVAGSGVQQQARRAVAVGGAGSANPLVWTIHPRTVTVTDASQAAVRAALDDAASGDLGPVLVTFARDAFPGADAPRTIELVRQRCEPSPTRASGLCVGDGDIVIDALDAHGRPGGVVLSAGDRPISVLRVYGSDVVIRGLALVGTSLATSGQLDTVAFSGPQAHRNRLEQCIVTGPASGDAVSVDGGAGEAGANVIVDSEIAFAQKRGVTVSTGGRAVVERTCVHDNRNGGLAVLAGGTLRAVENLVQYNVPGSAGHGIAAGGPSTLTTRGNLVRFAGGRGLSVIDGAWASFRDDYVADNQFAGAKVETTSAGAMSPTAEFRGTALVCNRLAGISGSCEPRLGDEGVPCASDTDCCGADGCVDGARCAPGSFPRGFGAVSARAEGGQAPHVGFGDAGEPGRNVLAWNRNAPAGANLAVQVTGSVVSARGNQWERCGGGALCDVAAVLDPEIGDVRPVLGATVDVGMPDGPRAGVPVLARVTPARPRAGELVRVFGRDFNAVEGTACAQDTKPVAPCSAVDPWVRQQNLQSGATRLRLLDHGGGILATLHPDAVTPTMLAFQMPFDCFAPLVLQVSKRDPSGERVHAIIPLCDAAGCEGQPAGVACDDGNACTSDDRCTGPAEARVCSGVAVTCAGACLTGSCDPQRGCVPTPAGSTCSDADACTLNDRCDGRGACVPGAVRTCGSPCHTGGCDPRGGCELREAGAVCRPAAGPCDAAELCNGHGAACPSDARLSRSTVCRPPAGACDLAERCDGVSAGCPTDVVKAAAVVCRPAGGECDVAESCSGASPACPADVRLGPAVVCRAGRGACDPPERCSGKDAVCPSDVLAGGETACDDGDACTTADRCDGAGRCTGGTPAVCSGACLLGVCDRARGCLAAPSTQVCSDGDACTVGDRCDGVAGECRPGPAAACDDGDACTVDGCDPVAGCRAQAIVGFDGLRCIAPECRGARARRKLDTATARLERIWPGGDQPPRRRALRRLRRQLARCGLQSRAAAALGGLDDSG